MIVCVISTDCSRKSPGLCDEWQIETASLSMPAHRQKFVWQAFRHGQIAHVLALQFQSTIHYVTKGFF